MGRKAGMWLLATVMIVAVGHLDAGESQWLDRFGPHAGPGPVPATGPQSGEDLVNALRSHQVMTPRGEPNGEQMRLLLARLNRMDAGKALQSSSATGAGPVPDPFQGGPWRLYAFWAPDVPDCRGMAAALDQVRSRGVPVHPVCLMSLRQWEGLLIRMHRRKDEIQALIKGGSDPTMVRFQAERWVSEYEGLQSFDRLFYHGKGVPAVEDVRSAVALGVTQVPSFRLVSPAGRVHALGGFGPGVDLVAWVESAVAWERASEPQLQGVGRGR